MDYGYGGGFLGLDLFVSLSIWLSGFLSGGGRGW
jgi:hypothetical protein